MCGIFAVQRAHFQVSCVRICDNATRTMLRYMTADTKRAFFVRVVRRVLVFTTFAECSAGDWLPFRRAYVCVHSNFANTCSFGALMRYTHVRDCFR